VGGTLLVANEDVADVPSGLGPVEFIVDGQNGPTGVAKNMLDPVAF
jgi:hypothetical protein